MKNHNLALTAKWLAALLMAAALVACNDDDDAPAAQTPPPPAPVVVANVSGTAAVGVPLANASVSAQCVTGPVLTGTTAVDGSWSIPMAGSQTFPCFVTVKGGTPAVELHSIAQTDAKINVTPLSDLVIAVAAGGDPAAWFNANKGTLSTSLAALVGKLPAAQTSLVATLKRSGYTVPDGDLLTVAFKPADGDPYDDLLEAIKVSLADAGKTYADLVTIVTSTGASTATLPITDVLTAVEVAAMPQLNSASLAITSGVLKMKTNATSASPVGAYVGGGQGNKAVLQLPGLAGMKLKDFKGLTMEVKANSSQAPGNPYVSLNMMIELDCTAAPLPATATVAQMRERRRLLTFDTYYKYIQGEPGSISSTAFSTVTMAPATGGWRISTGAADDNDTGLVEQGHEGGNYTQETLLTFKHDQFPNACIVDGISADGGLFRDKSVAGCDTGAALTGTASASCGKSHSGVFLFLGGSGNLYNGDWDVRKVRVIGTQERTFTFQ